MKDKYLKGICGVILLGMTGLLVVACGGGGGAAAPAPIPATTTPQHPRFAYVVSPNTDSVLQLNIGTGGALSLMAASAVASGTVVAPRQPNSIAVDPTSTYVYVTNRSSNSISQFRIGTNGSLTLVSELRPALPATVNGMTVSGGLKTITIDPTGRYAYAGSDTVVPGFIFQYTIGANGNLTPMATPAVLTGGTGAMNNPDGNPFYLAVDPAGTHLYSSNGSSISLFSIGAGGALTQISCGAPGTPGCLGTVAPTNFTEVTAVAGGPTDIKFTPSGNYFYVANMEGSVSAFSIGAGGVPTQISCGAVGTPGCVGTALPTKFATANANTNTIAINPSGTHLYASSSGGAESVSQFTINANGTLTPMAPASVATSCCGTIGINVDPTGSFAYDVNSTSIMQFTLGTNGALAPMPTFVVPIGWAYPSTARSMLTIW